MLLDNLPPQLTSKGQVNRTGRLNLLKNYDLIENIPIIRCTNALTGDWDNLQKKNIAMHLPILNYNGFKQ